MKTFNRIFRYAESIKKVNAMLPIAALLFFNPVMAQNQQAGEPTGAALSMARMMDPNTYMQMMTMAMDPRIWANPISSCVACHDNEDVGRYQQMFGPFISGMTNPTIWANPENYNGMMASMTDPKAAEHWQRAVEKKYGLEAGAALPQNMHSFWPVAPAVPPAQ